MEYIIVYNESLIDLQYAVNGKLQEGYELHGFLVSYDSFLVQAMIKAHTVVVTLEENN